MAIASKVIENQTYTSLFLLLPIVLSTDTFKRLRNVENLTLFDPLP
ncbi:MAG: hypothetical protein AAGA75_13690 [Cyanobacteria bacterium P01_E01_bin.6]